MIKELDTTKNLKMNVFMKDGREYTACNLVPNPLDVGFLNFWHEGDFYGCNVGEVSFYVIFEDDPVTKINFSLELSNNGIAYEVRRENPAGNYEIIMEDVFIGVHSVDKARDNIKELINHWVEKSGIADVDIEECRF